MIEDQNRKESSKTKVAPSKETNNNKKKDVEIFKTFCRHFP
jgi:hypothetical protein